MEESCQWRLQNPIGNNARGIYGTSFIIVSQLSVIKPSSGAFDSLVLYYRKYLLTEGNHDSARHRFHERIQVHRLLAWQVRSHLYVFAKPNRMSRGTLSS